MEFSRGTVLSTARRRRGFHVTIEPIQDAGLPMFALNTSNKSL